jgi:hypothetical protein
MTNLQEWFASRYPMAYGARGLYRFSLDGDGYASNGISALRVNGVECGGKDIPGCSSLFRRAAIGAPVSLSALREWAGEDLYTTGDVPEDCPDCEGSGRDDCPHCDQEMDCETCDGAGNTGKTKRGTIEAPRREGVVLRRVLSMGLLRHVLPDGDETVIVGGNPDPLAPLYIHGQGWTAVVMPIRESAQGRPVFEVAA